MLYFLKKNKEVLQTNYKYSYYLSYTSKINIQLTSLCVNYLQSNNRYKAKIITNDKHEKFNWESEHNYLSDNIEFNNMILKYKNYQVEMKEKNSIEKFIYIWNFS